MKSTDNYEPKGLAKEPANEPEADGLDSAIERVKSYIQNPRLVTPETLQMLLTDLEDYQSEEKSEPDEPHHGLTILIGQKGEKK